MRKVVFSILMALKFSMIFGQALQTEILQDGSTSESVKGTWDMNLDLASRYIWRGQSWGGDYSVLQLYGNYNVSEKFSLGFWTTSNFKKEYYDKNGASKGYQELDFVLNYSPSDYLTVSLQDYYWPSTDRQEGVSNDFFNFGNDGSQSVDLQFLFDFSERELPLWATLSTLIAGNDFRYKDENDEKGKQNFTTYIEFGYTYEAPLKTELAPVIGFVINNKAKYYTYADYDQPSFVNLGCKLSRDFELGKHFTMPVWLNYTYNAASHSANLEPFGKQFLVVGTTLTYE
jgi:hypothetical protein